MTGDCFVLLQNQNWYIPYTVLGRPEHCERIDSAKYHCGDGFFEKYPTSESTS